MPENRIPGKEPLWLLIEKEIPNYQTSDFSDQNRLVTAGRIAATLDKTGYQVSNTAGNWMQLTTALSVSDSVGRPFIKDLDQAIGALTLDSIGDTNAAAWTIISDLSKAWKFVMEPEIRSDLKDMVAERRIDLVIARGRELGGEQGIRFLVSEEFQPAKIVESMGISDDEYKAVQAKIDAELAEIKRVKGLLADKPDASEQDKIKHLLNKDVADDLILEIGGFDQAALETARKAMEAELAEKKRLQEEEAARKAAEAAGPSLDEISADEMLEFIENVREILEFSDDEKEIRVMCEQSSIPKALIDIAVSEPDKLDELEKKAEG